MEYIIIIIIIIVVVVVVVVVVVTNGALCFSVLQDAQIGFLIVLFLLIVAGNAIVLAAISLSKERRRSRMNFFIMHLAVCGQ